LVAKVWINEPRDQTWFWVVGFGSSEVELLGGEWDLGESGGVVSSAKTDLKKFIWEGLIVLIL
jgi:hypothetical protein